MKKYAHITGTGSGIPEKVLTNFDLEKMVDTSDDWIISRTGISRRHLVADGIAASDLAAEASRQAIERAGLTPLDIDLILLATVSPDKPLPSTACLVQDKIGAFNAAVMDIVAACSGFIYCLSVAKAMIETEQARNILVIGVETLSRLVNWHDRNTCVLFGDGCGAAVVQARETPGGIIGTYMKSNGRLADLLTIPAGGCKIPLNPVNIQNGDRFIQMAGPDVYKNAVKAMEEAGTMVLERTGLSGEQIDLMIPHQANIRIIDSTAKRLRIPMERVYVNIHEYGNTSAASIAIALNEAMEKKLIQAGHKVLLVAFGAGFTWGSVIVEF
jgi:3-oxoacyl-[acyl-carrier-protein] synthase-3